MVQSVHKELQDLKVTLENKDNQDQLDHKALKVQEVLEEPMVLKDQMAQVESREFKDHQELLVTQEHKDLKVTQELQDQRVSKDMMVYQEKKENLE